MGTITELSDRVFHEGIPNSYPRHPDMLRVVCSGFVTYITAKGDKYYSLKVEEREAQFWSVHATTGTIDYPPLELRNELFGDVLMEELL